MSLLIGSVFYKSGSRTLDDVDSLNASFGALLIILIQSVFPEHRPIFVREYSTNHYSALIYFLSRLTLEAFLTSMQMILLVCFIVTTFHYSRHIFSAFLHITL